MLRPMPKPKPPSGMYPGSGVAPGGQQGRPSVVHGGVGGARRGGYTPGATGARAPRRGGGPPPIQIPPPIRPADYNQLMTALLSTSLRQR